MITETMRNTISAKAHLAQFAIKLESNVDGQHRWTQVRRAGSPLFGEWMGTELEALFDGVLAVANAKGK